RINKLFKKNDKLIVRGAVNKYFVESMLGGLPIKIYSKKVKGGKEIIEWTMDDETTEFVKAVFLNKKVGKSKGIKLLKVLTDTEVEKFAKIKKLKFKANKKDKDVQKFLDDIEEKHPNIKYNLVKNIGKLKELTNA
ncbi:MAG: hypothetical protein V3V78_01880, partial [Candidatus Woesearchaeota archaeon]